MAKGPTAKRYATALFQLAQAERKEQAWLDALRQAGALFAEPFVALFFSVPRVSREHKLDAVRQAFPQVERTLLNFLGLLALRQATPALPQITREYAALLNASQGRVQAVATSAVVLSAQQREQLRQQVGRMLEQDVVLETAQDPAIIGGVVVRIGDRVLDGSVRARLQGMRAALR